MKQGDQLFTIDRRPYENALAQAKGSLASARAALAFTTADLERGSSLVRESTISQQVYDQRTQAKRVAEAQVSAQEAAVAQAELDLQFTELRSPISGRIGDRRVSAGNLVTGGTSGTTTLLATIVATDPIRFEFTFDERPICAMSGSRDPALGPTKNLDRLPATLKLIDERDFAHEGRMDFVDNVIEKRQARSAGVRSLPIPRIYSRPACSHGFAFQDRPHIRHCWCRMSPSAQNRSANSSIR